MRTIGRNENGGAKLPLPETVSTCRNNAAAEGFKDVFSMTPRGLYSLGTSRYYRPEQVTVQRTQQVEGEPGQGGRANMYLIETTDGIKGTLTEPTSGPRDPGIPGFIGESENIRHQMERCGRNEC